MSRKITIQTLDGIPLIKREDDLGAIIAEAVSAAPTPVADGDIIVIAQKIVSKAAGRFVDLATVTPGDAAKTLAAEVGKDPRLVEVILWESRSVIRKAPGVLITRHKRGWVMANAGIDSSNVAAESCGEVVLLLPENPDEECQRMREQFFARFGVAVGVIINDSFGRPWRMGTTGVAIGAAGLPSLWDRRGEADLFGRELKVTQQAIADELASAASLLQGQGAEGCPVAIIRGYGGLGDNVVARPAADLMRAEDEDLFR